MKELFPLIFDSQLNVMAALDVRRQSTVMHDKLSSLMHCLKLNLLIEIQLISQNGRNLNKEKFPDASGFLINICQERLSDMS